MIVFEGSLTPTVRTGEFELASRRDPSIYRLKEVRTLKIMVGDSVDTQSMT